MDDIDKEKVAEEVVDVFNYLIRFTSKMDIDIVTAYEKKMKKLEKKYPVDKVKGKLGRGEYLKRKEAYRRGGIN